MLSVFIIHHETDVSGLPHDAGFCKKFCYKNFCVQAINDAWHCSASAVRSSEEA